MPVMKTNISWTDSTWNPTTGCTKVSAGCEHCYAEFIVEKRWKQRFDLVTVHPDRVAAVRRFSRLFDADGLPVPRRVFVNSMSDLMHDAIPDAFRDQCFEAMEGQHDAVFQVLTKRPMTMRRYIEKRYAKRGMPAHIWLGVSVEDNRVKGRIDMLRTLKQLCGCVAFLSVEPLIGDPDRHDYGGIDQVLVGGESGFGARPMEPEWARRAVTLARQAGAAVWFKQWGQWRNNPLYRNARGESHLEKVRWAIAHGEQAARIEPGKKVAELVMGEKGGATLDGQIWHEMPPAFDQLTEQMRGILR